MFRVGFVLAMFLLPAATLSAQERSPQFGHEWVHSNPFNLMSLVQLVDTLDLQQYRDDLHHNTLFAWKPREGLAAAAAQGRVPWHMQVLRKLPADHPDFDAPLTDAIKATSQQMYDTYPGHTGWMLWDEPRRVHFEKMGAATAWYRQQFPDSLVYSNILAAGGADGKYYYDISARDANGIYPDPPGGSFTYEDYVRDYLQIVKPDVLMVDPYPYRDDSDFVSSRYFLTLATVRRRAKGVGIPYWIFTQTFGGGVYHTPSESEARMNAYSALGYGFTGISSFLYHDPSYQALLDPDTAQPTALYGHIAQINREVANLGKALRLLTSTNVRYVLNPDNGGSLPAGTDAWTAGNDDDPYITRIIGARGDLLIGHFTPALEEFDGDVYENEIYFMLVNLLQNQSSDADGAEQPTRIEFDFGNSGINSLQRLNRLTGEVEVVSLLPVFVDGDLRYQLNTILPGGTGDLYKYNTGAPFVVPEPFSLALFASLFLTLGCCRRRTK